MELMQALQEMADRLQFIDTGDVWQRFTCSELDSVAAVLRASGRPEVADFITSEHARHDEPDDDHYSEVG